MRCCFCVLPALLGLVVWGSALASAAEPRTFRTPFFTVQIAPNDRVEFSIPSRDKRVEARPATQAGPLLVAPLSGPEELPAPQPQGRPQGQQQSPRPFIVPPSQPAAPLPSTVPPTGTRPAAPVVLPTTPSRPMTHREFAASFQPVPGHYEVVLLHPRTYRPVKVRFTLPPGYVQKINVDSNEVEFDYGRFEVELYFKRNGTVEVDLED